MPGGWSDPKRTYRVNSENLERRIYVRAYTKEEVVGILKREGVYEKLSDAEKMQVMEIVERVYGKDSPVVLNDTFSEEPKKTFLVKVKPEDLKQIGQREVYVLTSKEGDAEQKIFSRGLQVLLIPPDFIVEEVQEEDVPIILEDPYSAIDPIKR